MSSEQPQKATPVAPPDDDAQLLQPVVMIQGNKSFPGMKDWRPINEYKERLATPAPPASTNGDAEHHQDPLAPPVVDVPPTEKETADGDSEQAEKEPLRVVPSESDTDADQPAEQPMIEPDPAATDDPEEEQPTESDPPPPWDD